MEFFEENPGVAKAIFEKATQAARARAAAKKARELVRRKSALETSRMPGKLADCREKEDVYKRQALLQLTDRWIKAPPSGELSP